jgi:hypothetical protein
LISFSNIFFSALVAFAVLVNAMADYYTKYYISIVTVLWATTFSLLILFLPKLQAFIQQQRQLKEKKDASEKISASQLVMAAAAATVGFGTNDPSYQKQQHFMDPSDATELLSLGEILGSDAPVFRPTMNDNKGRNHGSFVEVYEADIPARKVFRYFPFLSHWEMLHIMVFPWLGYFTYISVSFEVYMCVGLLFFVVAIEVCQAGPSHGVSSCDDPYGSLGKLCPHYTWSRDV